MTLNEKIASLKKLYPTLSKGINEEIVELNKEEYEATIKQWAEFELNEEKVMAEMEAAASTKAALLDRLGITEDEAKLLLA